MLIITHGGRIHANRCAEQWREDEPDQAVGTADPLPVLPPDGLSLHGMRNDVFVDITPAVAKKIAAMAVGPLTRHLGYSQIDLRETCP
ncbi:MAG: hypothetical protein ABW215_19180 [Kibdelosporangium sp.]